MSNLDTYTYMSNTHTRICQMCIYIETLYVSNMYIPVRLHCAKSWIKRDLYTRVYANMCIWDLKMWTKWSIYMSMHMHMVNMNEYVEFIWICTCTYVSICTCACSIPNVIRMISESAVSNTHTHTCTRQYILMCRIPKYMNISYIECQKWSFMWIFTNVIRMVSEVLNQTHTHTPLHVSIYECVKFQNIWIYHV